MHPLVVAISAGERFLNHNSLTCVYESHEKRHLRRPSILVSTRGLTRSQEAQASQITATLVIRPVKSSVMVGMAEVILPDMCAWLMQRCTFSKLAVRANEI